MKRVLSALFCLIIVFSFSACTTSKVDFENFTECKEDFETVSKFLRTYYIANASNESVVFDFRDGNIAEGGTIVSDEYYDEIVTIVERGFSYAWVEEDYIIFWEDEMKKYGVLFSENPKTAIVSVKKWYKELQSRKLEKNWYEIGALDSI